MRIIGEGTIEALHNKAGKAKGYRIRHNLGWDKTDKKYKYSSWRGGFKTKPEARKGLESYRQELEGGLKVDADRMTFGEYAQQWNEARKASGNFADSTLELERYNLKRLLKHLDNTLLRDIDTSLIP
jgi:hypothetical protein